MHVLLISPVDPNVPQNLKNLLGGENTYTKVLISHPPKGVRFAHFEAALATGDITYHPLQYFFLLLQKLRILPLGPRVQAIVVNKKYDLIYVHAHPVKIEGIRAPLVISDSSSNIVFLESYLKWSKVRLKLIQSVKRILFKLFHVIDEENNNQNADRIFVFSQWTQKIKKDIFQIKNCQVIYPGFPIPLIKNKRILSKEIKLLFVGVWFERKGGQILLEVFHTLLKKYPYLHLTILGEIPPQLFSHISIYEKKNITHHAYVSYRVLQSYYQTHDILVHVPPEIEGYGMTVPEAMSYGMVPVVSDICVLPEFVEHGISGLIVKAGSVRELEKALTRLIRSETLRKNLSLGARKRFIERFSLPVFHAKLMACFIDALSA